MNELALFAGAGGGLLATTHLLGWRTVCYVERDEYCVEVIKARIQDGYLDDAPIWDDVRTFDGTPWRGCVDIVTAGFPCQPFSLAGRQNAENDERNMWPDTIRVIREIQSRWVLLENVPGLLAGSHGYYGQVLGDLAESGYDAKWRVLSAAEVGAPHRRDRLWIVANRSCSRRQQDARGAYGYETENEGWTAQNDHEFASDGESDSTKQIPAFVADANQSNRYRRRGPVQMGRIGSTQSTPPNSHTTRAQWGAEPTVGRVAYGVAHRVDRLNAIGNGQVPAVVKAIWELLTQAP